MNGVRVTLTKDQIHDAAFRGCRRQTQDLLEMRRDRHGAPPGMGWQRHIEGTLGEKALSVLTGIPWTANIGEFKSADVGPFQVRATHYLDGRLVVHPDEDSEKKWVLVRGEPPTLIVGGWCYGHEAKQPQFWTDPGTGRPAFFVPDSKLRHISTLIKG